MLDSQREGVARRRGKRGGRRGGDSYDAHENEDEDQSIHDARAIPNTWPLTAGIPFSASDLSLRVGRARRPARNPAVMRSTRAGGLSLRSRS
jgi:hypothetical protein